MRPKTSHLNSQSITRDWHVIDADGAALGHLAVKVAMVLQGKHKATLSEHCDCGDHIVVVNASRIAVSGNKADQKTYVHHTGYPGGQRHVPFAKLLDEKPDQVIVKAVKRMLPKNKLGRQMLTKLHVYGGPDHRHSAQNPQPLSI